MAEASQTPYAVALELTRSIASSEGKVLGSTGQYQADRAYVLALYRECLAAVASKGGNFSQRD